MPAAGEVQTGSIFFKAELKKSKSKIGIENEEQSIFE